MLGVPLPLGLVCPEIQAIEDAPNESDDARATAGGEADEERSSEREEDLP